MRTHDLLTLARGRLRDAGVEEASFEAALLLSHVSGLDRSRLIAYPESEQSEAISARFLALLERRCAGEPFQHLTGTAGFMGLDFSVSPDVLVPRPDTETLAEWALSLVAQMAADAPDSERPIRVLDIGTGSGCLPISLAVLSGLDGDQLSIDALDLSTAALAVARANAASNGVADRIRFLHGDALRDDSTGSPPADPPADLSADPPPFSPDRRYDLILSNPPYIPSGDISGLMREVRDHEPLSALDGGEDGLVFYRRFASAADRWLSSRGRFLMEVGIGQAHDVCRLFLECGFSAVARKDLQGIDRVVMASRKP